MWRVDCSVVPASPALAAPPRPPRGGLPHPLTATSHARDRLEPDIWRFRRSRGPASLVERTASEATRRISGVSAEPRQTSAAELKQQIEAERGGRPFLVLRDGAGEQRILAIEEGTTELWVGRGEAAGLRLDWDEEVSALHAQ